jgi:PAS domain S-box-containing protein
MTEMNETLRVLILEDNPDDCELMERELSKGGISFDATRVETKDGYIREIEDNTPDLLLVDYSLPQFDGLSALRIARRKCPGVPFIFVSGVIEEETAIESLRAGATDYVFKHRLSRLVPVVKRALREVEERRERVRAEIALSDSELRYRELVENINDVIFSQDAEGHITYISPSLERMSNYKAEDLVGKSFIELIHPDDLPGLMESYKRTMEGNLEPWEFRLFDRNGTVRWVRTSSRPLVRDGEISGLLGILTDITKRKRAEEWIRFLSSVVEQSTEGMAIADLEGTLLFANRFWSEMHGYESPEDLIGKHMSISHSSEQMEKDVKPFNQIVMSQGHHSGEVGHIRRDGSTFPTLMTTTLLRDEQGNPIAIAGIAKDIAERKRAEERIRHLNMVIRSIRNVNQLITKEKDRDILLQGTCDNLIKNRGYHRAWTAILNDSREFVTHNEAGWGELFLPKLEMAKKGKYTRMAKRTLRKPGVTVVMDPLRECSDCPLSMSYGEGMAAMTARLEYEGTVYGLLSVTIPEELAVDEEEQSLFGEAADDIAFALYNIEKEKEREAIHKALAERMKEISCLYRINEMSRREDLGIDDFLREAARIIPAGWQFPDLTCCRIVFEGREHRTDNFRETEWKQEADIVIDRNITGKITVCLLEPPPAGEEPFLPEEQELIEEVAFTHAVIINRRQSTDALRKSEEKYRTIIENMEEGYYEVDLEGNFTFFNDSLCKSLGYSRDELMGMNNREYMDKDTAKRVYEIFSNVYRTGHAEEFYEWEIIRKDGKIAVHAGSVSLIRDSSGGVVGFRGVVRDITEWKRAEEQIRLSLREKEIMLQEIHHRVKNNMQVISSMLGLQKKYIQDEKDLELFSDSQNRIRSMAIVHEKLYRSQDLAQIDFADYTRDLVHHLIQFYAKKKTSIDVHVEFESIYFGIDIAIPCALIVNELISNSLKHAFPNGRKGEIYVNITEDAGTYILNVGDNGIGFTGQKDFRNTESLGLQLVDAFVRQLKGTISLNQDGGTSFSITFKDKKSGNGVP